MGARSLLRLLLLLLALAIGGGYATAWASREACIDEAWKELEPRGLVAHPLGEMERPLLRKDLEARVTAPFRVEVSYLVPDGLESTVYAQRYQAWPWKRTLVSREAHRIRAAL